MLFRRSLKLFAILFLFAEFGTAEKDKILSRKKRYLVFPEGSSLQVVYDSAMPIVGHVTTNLFILGITCSLAWPLPKEPIHFKKDIEKKLEADGILYRKDNITNIKYVDKNVISKDKTKQTIINNSYGPMNYNRLPPTSNKIFHYFPPMKYGNQQKFQTVPNGINDYSKSYVDRLHGQINNFISNANTYRPWKHTKWVNNVPSNRVQHKWSPNTGYGRRRNYILPIFGRRRRSINSNSDDNVILTKEDQFFLNHHRNSRHNLYKHIEVFLNAHGKNGHECLLKALCETSQQSDEKEPGSFFSEIMRAIFSLPKSTQKPYNSIHQRYDEAHGTNFNCSDQFKKCEESIWNPNLSLIPEQTITDNKIM